MTRKRLARKSMKAVRTGTRSCGQKPPGLKRQRRRSPIPDRRASGTESPSEIYEATTKPTMKHSSLGLDVVSTTPMPIFSPGTSNTKLDLVPTLFSVPPSAHIFVGAPVADGYFVSRPSASHILRLRELEKEYVTNHSDLFTAEPAMKGVSASEWYKAVGVINSEPVALTAIRRVIDGTSVLHHMTLLCMHLPREPASDAAGLQCHVAGYVHFVVHGDHIDIVHLKVQNSQRGRSLGALLLCGVVRYAERVDCEKSVSDLRLSVMSRNVHALRFYEALGFTKGCREIRRLGKAPRLDVEYTAMRRHSVNVCVHAFAQEFRELCFERYPGQLRHQPN